MNSNLPNHSKSQSDYFFITRAHYRTLIEGLWSQLDSKYIIWVNESVNVICRKIEPQKKNLTSTSQHWNVLFLFLQTKSCVLYRLAQREFHPICIEYYKYVVGTDLFCVTGGFQGWTLWKSMFLDIITFNWVNNHLTKVESS